MKLRPHYISDTPGKLVIGFRSRRDGRKDGISNDGDVRLFRRANVEYFSPRPLFAVLMGQIFYLESEYQD
jgi:hypothetical protein